jgi:hypothetical protein
LLGVARVFYGGILNTTFIARSFNQKRDATRLLSLALAFHGDLAAERRA